MISEKILVIDKDDKARQCLVNYLTSKGFYVYSKSSLADAAECMGKERPDLVFADLHNDHVSQLVKMLQSDTHLTQVVIVSHAENAEYVVSALRAGAEDFVLKPVKDTSILDSVLNKLFSRARIFRLNQRYRKELEEANKELKVGIAELKADQNAGLKVQMKMLPENAQTIEGLYFEHLIKPSLYLSGDFLDYFKLDNDRVLFYFADVSGHGASSAFVTVLLKNLSNRLLRNLRRGSSDDILNPTRYLERVNHELLETKLGKHVTMFVGIIEPQTRQLTYAVGAHFPMPILCGGGRVEYLEGSGMPVGLFDNAEFNQYTIELPENFSLVIFSDGVHEILNDKTLTQKEARLLELIAKEGQTIALLGKGLNLSGLSDLPDDIAILTLTETKFGDA